MSPRRGVARILPKGVLSLCGDFDVYSIVYMQLLHNPELNLASDANWNFDVQLNFFHSIHLYINILFIKLHCFHHT